MPKPRNDAQRAFLKGMSEMTANFRRDMDAHFALIGKATCSLIEQGRPLTPELLAEAVVGAAGADEALAARSLKQLRHHATPSLRSETWLLSRAM